MSIFYKEVQHASYIYEEFVGTERALKQYQPHLSTEMSFSPGERMETPHPASPRSLVCPKLSLNYTPLPHCIQRSRFTIEPGVGTNVGGLDFERSRISATVINVP